MLHIIVKDGLEIKRSGVFCGFHWVMLMVIIGQGMSGFVASLMLHYADAVLKGFAIAIAAVVSTFASIVLFHTKVNESFLLGATLVGIAVKM